MVADEPIGRLQSVAELGGALLHEGHHGLGQVVRVEERRVPHGHEALAIIERMIVRVAQHGLGALHHEWAVGCDRRSKLSSASEHRVDVAVHLWHVSVARARTDTAPQQRAYLIDEAHVRGSIGVDRGASECELPGVALADDAADALQRAQIGHDANLGSTLARKHRKIIERVACHPLGNARWRYRAYSMIEKLASCVQTRMSAAVMRSTPPPMQRL